MNHNRQRYVGLILVGVGFVLMAAGIYSMSRPAVFEAHVRIRPDLPDCGCLITNDDEARQHRAHASDYYTEEIENMLSDSTLARVVGILELDGNSTHRGSDNRTPQRSTRTVATLRHQIRASQVVNSTFVKVRVRSEDPLEGARIANAIAEAYRDLRQERWETGVAAGIVELVKHLELTEQAITKAEGDLERLRQELKIPSPEPEHDFLRTNFRAYVVAKKNLDDEKDVANLLARKIKAEQDDLPRFRDSQEAILERAVPASAPRSRPRRIGRSLLLLGLVIGGSGVVIALPSRAKSS